MKMSTTVARLKHMLAAPSRRIVATVAVSVIAMSSIAIAVAGASPAASPSSGASADVSPSDATAIALRAAEAAEDDSPTELLSVETTLQAGIRAITPEGAIASDDSQIAQLGEGSGYVEVMQGNFSLDATRPANAALPKGSVLSIIVRASNGSIAFTALNNSGPTVTELEKLGTVVRTVPSQ